MAEARPTLIRRFQGVNRQIDPVYLGPSFLYTCTNWIPDTTFVLTKRPGTLLATTRIGAGTVTITFLHRSYSSTTAYLYAYDSHAAGGGGDKIWFTTNEGATWSNLGSYTFTSSALTGRMIRYGNTLYVGNGVDPIKKMTMGGAATNLQSVASFTDGSAAPSIVADSGAAILTGTYSFAWAIYDHTNKLYLERASARTITNTTANDVHIEFAVPTGFATNGGALSSQYRAHLFISPINLPLEFAHDQTPEGITAGTTIIRQITADGLPVPLKGTDRTGNIFAVHRSRLWIAGDSNNLNRVVATHVLVQGLEQAIFDTGEFFPANAVINFPAPITALAVCSVSVNDDPQSPLAIFTLSSTTLWFGDILDDPAAYKAEVSSRIGCVGDDAHDSTPYGVFFLGVESVYRIPPGGGVPEDVGWPIAPDIKAIPSGARATALCRFHKGFLKVYFAPPGGATNAVEYWLDLRNGGLTNPPSWSGPHTGVSPTAMAAGVQDTDEYDKAFAALPATGRIVKLHQTSSYLDNGAIVVSTLQTGTQDLNAPFTAKTYALLRVTGKAESATTISPTLMTDSGQVWSFDQPLQFTGGSGGLWDTMLWDVDSWAGTFFEEVQTETTTDRPRGLSASVTMTHAAPLRVDLRDVDLLTAPVARPKRARGLGGTPSAGA